MVSSLDVMPRLLAIATTSITQLEGPQEVVRFLEMGAHCEDLVNEVFYTDDAILPQRLLNDCIVRDRYASAVHLPKATLVDQLTSALQVGIAGQV